MRIILKTIYIQFKNRFDLFNFVSHILIITISVYLAFLFDNIREERNQKIEFDYYKDLLIDDVKKSKVDLERDLEGHKKAFSEGMKILKMLSRRNIKLDSLNKSCNWDLVYSDFQFFPVVPSYKNLITNGNQSLYNINKLDTNLILLFDYDFPRIERMGKDFIQSKNIKNIWGDKFLQYFYIDPSSGDDKIYRRIENNAYQFNENTNFNEFKRHKLQLKYVNKKIINELYTKLELVQEIRLIKIQYYTEVTQRANETLRKLNRNYDED